MSDYSSVAHAWAHNLDKAHNSSHMSHDDGCIYSYSTCIGQRIEINGKVLFLLDTASYSNTTSGHQGWVRSAIPNDIAKEIFNFKGHERGSYRIISFYHGQTKEQRNKALIEFGMRYLMEEYSHCLLVPDCNALSHPFSRKGYEEMVRWFNVTGCMTVKKLLRMKFDDFRTHIPYMRSINCTYKQVDKRVRKFLQMMLDNDPIEAIVDMVNGEGTWADYQKRIEPLKNAEKTRRLRSLVFVKGPGWRGEMVRPTVHGMVSPVVTDNPINKKSITQHKKKGDYIQWLYNLRQTNVKSAYTANLVAARQVACEKAKERLEKHLGMRGWMPHDSLSPFRNNLPTSFNFNGTVFHFCSWHREKRLTYEEYQTYCSLPLEQQRQWVINKRQEVLEGFQEETRQHEEARAHWDQHWREVEEERRRYEELEASKREYIDELKKTPEGVRQLYHEGFKLYNTGSPSVFYGGNVLLRIKGAIVETSKGIKITIEECKRLWSLVKRWHENAAEFTREICRAVDDHWTITSYRNDILTAGCHSIAYSEMEYIANQLQLTA